jgi:hypothetical protein
MNESLRYIKGLYSLGLGSPFYRHSTEKEVPWPHIDNPLRGASEETIQKWIAAGGQEEVIRSEVKRLNRIKIPKEFEDSWVLSNNTYRPERVTYTSQLPYYSNIKPELLKDGVWGWSAADPEIKAENHLPGKAIIQEFRISMNREARLKRVVLKLGNNIIRDVQEFKDTEGIITFLQTYLGISLVMEVDDQRLVTVPFFFSRDPSYGLPIFVVDQIQVLFEIEGLKDLFQPEVYCRLEIIHSKEEVKKITRNHIHRIEDMNTSPNHLDKWLFMSCFWREVDNSFIHNGRVRLTYEGGLDEEIRGVFWKISNPSSRVRLFYEFEGAECIDIVDWHSAALLSEMELRTRIIPTTTGSFLTNCDGRKGYGGILLSRYVDSHDCESGLSPRNGELYLEFSDRESILNIYLLTNRDFVIYC